MKHKKIILLIIILLLNIFIISNSQIVKAEEETPEVPQSMTNLRDFAADAGMPEYKDPSDIAMTIIDIFIAFLGLILLIMIIYSGYQWMTSGGNEEVITKAKKRLTSSIIGLGIILLSYVIAVTIIKIIQGQPIIPQSPWD